MRTKHILTALALPALFAACTADEFETVNQNAGLQEERAKVAENFTLLTSGIQTRYAVEGGAGISFNFEKGDQIGAAIIDEYNPDAEKPEDFIVIPSLAGNNPFEFQGSEEWTSNTQLGIGHYLFMYPYNSANNNRAAVAYELPVIQELGAGAEGLNAAVEKGNKAIAAAVLHEGEESVDISLKNIFTYPKLTINFDNGENVTTVSQIVLKANSEDDAFIVKGGFDHEVVAAMFGLDEEKGNTDFKGKDYYKQNKTTKKYYIDWDLVDTEDLLLAENGENKAYIPFKDGLKSDYIIVKFPEGTKVQPATNTNNKYVEARIMMPTIEKFDDRELAGKYTLYVYTDNGVYSTAFAPASFSFSDTTDKEAIETALQRNKSNGLRLKALNTGVNKKGDAGTIVTTLADWNDLVDRFGDTKQNQKIIIVGDNFAFDGAEDIEWPKTCTFTITTDVKVKGDVEMKNVNVDGTINVEKGATLTVNNTLTAEKEEVEFADGTTLEDIETVIKNEGTVVIAAEYDKAAFDEDKKTKDAYVGVSAIENKGTLTVNKEAKAKFELTNIRGAVVNNNGEVTVKNDNAYSDAKNENEAGNNGTINNNGTLRTGDFTNVAPEIENEGKENEVIENMPVINNAKGARMVAEGDFTNNATLVNEGTLACLNTTTGSITNNEVLDSKKGAVTYITDNTKGKVIVYEAKPLTVTINSSSKGIVEYETSAKSEDFKESLVNQVIASGDLTIADGTISMLIFKGDATLTLAKPAGTSTKEGVINGLTIEEGNVVLASNVTVSTLIIKEEGSLNVPGNITMTYTGDEKAYTNEGLILVGGTFSAKGVAVANGGDVQNNGGEITWAESAAVETAREAYKTALVAAVKTWANDPASGNHTVNKLSYDIINGENDKRTPAEVFETYYGYHTDDEGAMSGLTEAFAAYQKLDANAKITEEYAYAAKKVVADKEAEETFKNLELTWAVNNAGEGKARIYEKTEDALKAFKAAVAKGDVKGVTNTLDKVVLCSSTTNYAPDGSQVMTTDKVYTVFGTSAIGYAEDWSKAGLTMKYNTESTWSVDLLKMWIQEVATSESDNLYIKQAKKFVEDNDLISESRNWTYSSHIVNAIAGVQLRGEKLN